MEKVTFLKKKKIRIELHHQFMYQALCPAVVSPVKWNCRLVWIITNKLSCLSVKPSSLHLEVFFSFRLSLEGPDLNKDQAFTYIRFIPHTRHRRILERKEQQQKKTLSASLLAFGNTRRWLTSTAAECKCSGPSGTGGVWYPRVQQDVLDAVLQEKHLHQTSDHLRRWRLQSLVHLQLPVGGSVPVSHCSRGGEGLSLNIHATSVRFLTVPCAPRLKVEYFLRRLTEAMGSGCSEEKFANYRLQLHTKSCLSAWDLIDLVGAGFCKGLHPQTVSMGINEVFQELILDVVKQVRQPVDGWMDASICCTSYVHIPAHLIIF